MTRRRPDLGQIDLAPWPAANAGALEGAVRQVYVQREQAIQLYAAGTPLAAIERASGIGRKQLYRLLERCLAPHEDGRLYGFRGLLPYQRAQTYCRSAPIPATRHRGRGGAAGAFRNLMDAHPALQDWLAKKVKDRALGIEQLGTDGQLRIRLRGLANLHVAFLHECRKLGLCAADYPFNTEQLARRSLAAAFKAEILRHFGAAARTAGATHLKGRPRSTEAPAKAAQQALDIVEFDGHRLDVRLKIVVRDPLGFEQEFEIERIWLLVIIDVYSRAVLGYHVSLDREYNHQDVIRTLERTLEPHPPRAFTLPGMGYGRLDGFPSQKLPELAYATWTWFKLDGAKANLADEVRHVLTTFIGCHVDVGPAHTPDDRPYIERFFGTLASRLSSRLPGYTGSGPKDLRRALADPKGNLRLFVALTELEDLLEASLAAYNATPHNGLNGRTPLEAIEHSVRDPGTMLSWLPDHKRRSLCLMQRPQRATVRGYLAQGQRGHVNFHGVRYTNDLLAASASFLGQSLKLYFNSQDIRTVRAIAADGTDLGVLKAQGAWGEIAHDLKLRQEVLKLRGRKKLQAVINQSFIEQFVQAKIHKAKRSRRAASSLARTVRALTSAPSPMVPLQPASVAKHEIVVSVQAAPVTMPMPVVEIHAAPAAIPKKIEPEILSIGSGFAGELSWQPLPGSAR